MEPFRIIPTRRRLRSSKRVQEASEKKDELDIHGTTAKVPTPHPDPSTLAKEMEEFEKLMLLDSSNTSAPDVAQPTEQPTEKAKEDPTKQAASTPNLPPKPEEEPTPASEPYEPDEPTNPTDEEYVPEKPTTPDDQDERDEQPSPSDVQTKNFEPYDPDQPTEEDVEIEPHGEETVPSEEKVELPEVEADMPQLLVDSEREEIVNPENLHNHVDKDSESVTKTDNSAADKPEQPTGRKGENKSEQENLFPELWLRKKEKKKKHSHSSKHKKPLVEWRIGVLRKDYVRTDLTKFPVDENLMATTKHKWNDESEVEHLKECLTDTLEHMAESNITVMPLINGPNDTRCDASEESEERRKNSELEKMDVLSVISNSDSKDVCDRDTINKELKCVDDDAGEPTSEERTVLPLKNTEGEVKANSPEKREVASDSLASEEDGVKHERTSISKETNNEPALHERPRDGTTDEVQEEINNQELDEAEKMIQINHTVPEEKKPECVKEAKDSGKKNEAAANKSCRESSEEKSKVEEEMKETKENEERTSRMSTRQSRRRTKDETEEKKEKEESVAKIEKRDEESSRRRSRRGRNRDDSDDERKEDSRDSRRRSSSRERRRYDDRYDRYDRESRRSRRSDRRSRERSEERRHRDDDRRHDRNDSREREKEERRYSRRGRSETDSKSVDKATEKEESKKKTDKERNVKAEKENTDVKNAESTEDNPRNNTLGKKDQSAKPDPSNKASARTPIKFNFTSRAVRRTTRSSSKAKGGVFGDEEEEESEKPLSDLRDVCGEREEETVDLVEEQTGRRTRSKGKEESMRAEVRESRQKSSSPSTPDPQALSAANTLRTRSTKNSLAADFTLKKDIRKEAPESESDSGAEFSLLGLGDEAPKLYPETILDSQLEMELLANAFCSTDTEADMDIDKANEKLAKEGEEAKEHESAAQLELTAPQLELPVDSVETLPDKEDKPSHEDAAGEAEPDSAHLPSSNSEQMSIVVDTPPEVREEESKLSGSESGADPERKLDPVITAEAQPEKELHSVPQADTPHESEDRSQDDGSPVATAVPRIKIEDVNPEEVEHGQQTGEFPVASGDLGDAATVETSDAPLAAVKEQSQSLAAEEETSTMDGDQPEDSPETHSLEVLAETCPEKGTILETTDQEANQIDQTESVVSLMSPPEVPPPGKTAEDHIVQVPMNVSLDPLQERTAESVLVSGSEEPHSKTDNIPPSEQVVTTDMPIMDDTSSHVDAQSSVVSKLSSSESDPTPGANTNSTNEPSAPSAVETIQSERRSSRRKRSRWGEEAKEEDENTALDTETVQETHPTEQSTIEVPSSCESQSDEDNRVGGDVTVCSNTAEAGENEPSVSKDNAESNFPGQAELQIPAESFANDAVDKELLNEGVVKRKRKSRWDPVVVPAAAGEVETVVVGQDVQVDPVKAVENLLTANQRTDDESPASGDQWDSVDPPPDRTLLDTASDGGGTPVADERDFAPGSLDVELSCSPSKRVKVEVGQCQSDAAESGGPGPLEIAAAGDSHSGLVYTDIQQQDRLPIVETEGFIKSQVAMTYAGGDNQFSVGAVHVTSELIEEIMEKLETDKKQDVSSREEDSNATKEEPVPLEEEVGEESMEEGEIEKEMNEVKEEEEKWDDSSGKEQGEIVDNEEEEVDVAKEKYGLRERHSRRSSLDKENIPRGGEHWERDRKREERDRAKEEPPRESREERRRKLYEEWGIVDRSKIPPFTELEENNYLTERRRSKAGKEARRMVCCCTTSREERREGITPCGEDCLNRILMIECGSRCPCGDYCTNKRFQKRENARVGVFYAEGKGHGLKAKEDIKANEFVMEYVGEVLNPSEFRQRAKSYSKNKNLHFYFMALKSDEIIDATEKGNVSRFMNHSCDPNCETQKWTVNGQLRVGFFTKKAVKAGTELTFDYQFEVYGQEAQKCLCGSEKCRGVIGKQKKQREGRDATPKRRGSIGERRRKDSFEDITLEDEIQQMIDELEEGGLRSNDHTIALSRFMVRAEHAKQRLALLKLLQETTEQTYLKYFLTHHGLRLLWSWMVDLGDNPRELQMQILLTLSKLPIPNKNALEDSKVMHVIERWSKDLSRDESKAEVSEGAKNESDVDSSSASETPSRSDTPISAAMAASLNANSGIEVLKSVAEATSSESDVDNELAPKKRFVLRQRLEMESNASPSSTASGDTDSNEKPSSSAGDVAKGELQSEEDVVSRQPDSASEAKAAATSSDAEGADQSSQNMEEEMSKLDKIVEGKSPTDDTKKVGEATNHDRTEPESQGDDVPSVASGKADSTDADVRDENVPGGESELMSGAPEIPSNKVLDSTKACSPDATDDPLPQNSDSATSVSVNASTIENGTPKSDQTSSVEAPSAGMKDSNNEAESKSEGPERKETSGLQNIITSLLASWSNLKEIYRIPKKEGDRDRDKERDRDHDRDRHRDHDRDRDRRHDRDRDYDRDRHRDRDRGRDRDRSRDRDDRHHRDRGRESDRDRHRDRDRDKKDKEKSEDRSRRKRSRSRSKERETKSSWSKDSDANSTPPKLRKTWKEGRGKDSKSKESKGKEKEDSKDAGEKEGKKLSKEERRHLFAMQVEAQEREEAARKEQEALLMAQWQESEQQRQQQMAPFIDANGFPVDPNTQSMVMNEHGMPIEVVPSQMGMGPMGGMPLGEPWQMHPDMQGQFPPPEHMGMEEGYTHIPEHHMMPHPDGRPMYDDSGFPIPPEQQHQHMMSMHPAEGMQPGIEYGMHPDMDPNAMGHHPPMDPNAIGNPHMDPHMDPSMMGQPVPAMDPHMMAQQAHMDANMVPPMDHMLPQQGDMVPQREMHIPQVVPIPAAPTPQVSIPHGPSEQELMPPPSLPAPSRKSKKAKTQKSLSKASAKAASAATNSATFIAPTPAHSQAEPNPVRAQSPAVAAGSVPPGMGHKGYAPQQQAAPVLQTPVLPQPPQQAAQTTFTFVTPDGMLVTQTITPLAAAEQSMAPHVSQLQQHVPMGVGQQQAQVTESIPSPPAKPKPAKLPPNWKTAQDSEGKTYYYHSITRQTQWEPPTWDEVTDGAYQEEEDEGSNTPTYDEKGKQKTTTAPADTSSEAAKRLKEAFRSKMSHHVIGYLNMYRKPDCKTGRITNTEDFKHLARKLTHGIMAKELKHCRNIEDLEVNENVKHKAKEYIKKYMGRYGKVYKKDSSDM
ncbi:uncharacterized protein [Diadema setosum]|uniref:uncharacterized protein n=1 Tax=Diadema setosum TaxID=31175 RepID=UPI003B3B79A3